MSGLTPIADANWPSPLVADVPIPNELQVPVFHHSGSPALRQPSTKCWQVASSRDACDSIHKSSDKSFDDLLR
jgi:hypothetical protein